MTDIPAAPDIYTALRNQVFLMGRGNLGPMDTDEDAPFGIVMDESVKGGYFYTLVAWGNGETSIYLSSGGGFIGAGRHKAPNTAARELIKFCANYVDSAMPVPIAPLPEAGACSFYFITDTGLFGTAAETRQLRAGDHELSLLYVKAQHLVAAIRIQAENG